MAIKNWNNGKPSFDYANIANLGVNLGRQVNAPLDISSEFSSIKDMLYYVTEGRYPANGTGVSEKVKDMKKYPYLGQIIALVNTETEDVTIYYIQTAEYDSTLTTDNDIFKHYFAEVGKATIGDNESINLDEATGILTLKNWGKEYYKETEQDGSTVWTKVTVDESHPWIAGLVPKVAATAKGFEIRWYVPSTKDVEGLTSSINTINDTLAEIKPIVNKAVTIDGDQEITGKKTFKAEGNTFEKPVIVAAPTAEGHAANKKYVDDNISKLGSVMNLAEVVDETTFNGYAGAVPAKWSNDTVPAAGDVVLVKITSATGDNLDKEYVVVEVIENSAKKLKFELLGDPSGLTSLTNTVNDLSDKVDGIDEAVAKKSANNTFSGSNTFSEPVSVADPTADNHAATRKYVDAADTAIKERVFKLETSVGKDDTTSGLKKDVKDLKEAVGDSTSGLVHDVAANTGNINTINDKLSGIAEGAQVNVIESIAVTGGTATVTVDKKKATIDITNVDKATEAGKVTNALTIFGNSYNGSTEVTITKDNIGTATADAIGLVKSSTGTDKVTVAADGTMSVGTVSKATNADNATEAGKVSSALTFGTKSYDGSKAKEITLTDLGFDGTNYATAAQGGKADTAIQGVTVAGQTATINESTKIATITSDNLKTGLGLGTAAYKADTYFAKAVDLTSLDEAVAKKSADNTFSGSNTFSGTTTVKALNSSSGDNEAANKKYVDDKVSTSIAAVDSMRFCGLLGGEGNITKLPSENVKNGDTYKVSVAGTYNNQAAKAGDMFIALVTTGASGATIAWQYIPSADDGNVSAANSLTADQVIVGNGNKDVKTLAAGTDGNVLKMVGGKPAWSAESLTDVTSTDGTLEKTKTGTVVNLEVAKVNVDKLEQTDNTYIILNCGSSTVNI